MEFDEVVVKESPGLCRCCLSEGCYKDLGSEYSWMGDTEIYADMLLECFDIGVSQHAEGPNGPNRLICEVCITRLRDACNFKKQVLDSEKRFIDMLHRGDFKSKGLVFPSDMKQEAEALDVEYLDDLDFGDDAEDLLKTDTEAEPSQSEDITVASLPPVKRGRGRPRKSAATPVKPERRAKLAKLEDKPRSSKAAAKGHEREDGDTLNTLLRVRANLSVLLRSTNVLPFKYKGNCYYCFFCANKYFADVEVLREHMRNEHEGFHTQHIVKQAVPKTGQIKIDVTDLSCKRCSEPFEHLDKLTDHVVEMHEEQYYKGLDRFFFRVRLTEHGLKCLECGEQFDFFQQLLKHSESHEKGVFLCDTCGRGFEFYDKFKMHLETRHVQFKCNFCEKSFGVAADRKAHEAFHHKSRGYSCKECGLAFDTSKKMRRHVFSEHDPEKRCGKKQQKHIKPLNQKERDKCPLCDALVINVIEHMVCHSEHKPHVCEVCQKAFARKKNMVAHLKTHTKRSATSGPS